MSKSELTTPKDVFWFRFLWHVLAAITLFFIMDGLFHFPFSSHPLSSEKLNFGTAVGLAFIYSVGPESYSFLKKFGLFLLIVILVTIVQDLLMSLIGSFTLSFGQWFLVSLIGVGVSVSLFYRYDSKINLIPR